MLTVYWLPKFVAQIRQLIQNACYVDAFSQATEEQKAQLDEFFSCNSYVQGAYDQVEDFRKLNDEIVRLTKTGATNRLFYFALPPSTYASVAANVRETCMASGYERAQCQSSARIQILSSLVPLLITMRVGPSLGAKKSHTDMMNGKISQVLITAYRHLDTCLLGRCCSLNSYVGSVRTVGQCWTTFFMLWWFQVTLRKMQFVACSTIVLVC